VIASKNGPLNATAAARKKFDGGTTGQSTTSTPWSFDSVSRRNSTVPGSTAEYCVSMFMLLKAVFFITIKTYSISHVHC